MVMQREDEWAEWRPGEVGPVAVAGLWPRFRKDLSDERRRLRVERKAINSWTVTVTGMDGEPIDAADGALEQVLARPSVATCLAGGCRPPWTAWQDLFRRAQRLPIGQHLVISFLAR